MASHPEGRVGYLNAMIGDGLDFMIQAMLRWH